MLEAEPGSAAGRIISVDEFSDRANRILPHHYITILSRYESVKQMMEEGVKSSNIFEPFPSRDFGPELEELSKKGRFPYISDGTAVFNEIRAYVTTWLERAKAEKKEGGGSEDEEAKATAEFYRIVQESTKHQK